MNDEMIEFISHGIHSYSTYNKEVMSILIRNTGNQLFCPGPEYKSLYPDMEKFDAEYPKVAKFFEKVQRTAWNIASCTYPPTLSLMNGIVGGSGLAVGLNCKFACGTPNTVITITEPQNGFVPYGGTTFRYARLPRHLGMYLALTGQPLIGRDAFFAEVLSHYAPEQMYDEVLNALETNEYKGIQSVSNCVSDNLMMWENIPPESRDEFSFAELLDPIEKAFGKRELPIVIDTLENLETSADSETVKVWAKETLSHLRTASPLALHVTFKMIKEAATKSLEACLRMEHLAVQRMMGTPDYKLGVSKILGEIDEKKEVKWDPPTIATVRSDLVDKFFSQQIVSDREIAKKRHKKASVDNSKQNERIKESSKLEPSLVLVEYIQASTESEILEPFKKNGYEKSSLYYYDPLSYYAIVKTERRFRDVSVTTVQKTKNMKFLISAFDSRTRVRVAGMPSSMSDSQRLQMLKDVAKLSTKETVWREYVDLNFETAMDAHHAISDLKRATFSGIKPKISFAKAIEEKALVVGMYAEKGAGEESYGGIMQDYSHPTILEEHWIRERSEKDLETPSPVYTKEELTKLNWDEMNVSKTDLARQSGNKLRTRNDLHLDVVGAMKN
eukprot:CAMPEP_0167744914 /NCGR_PEP_ID=MMETSP0110_2-20121227/2856_1 /TAXON_ID=629695 /ORGANISM="Gymnochlora sp., Strain CCMP2014" /LENGTH=614 /DNA_ID=CAMNT_0007629489 /DNA_START=143 /DNA_END=1987 /DNA_ORIENTATION=+